MCDHPADVMADDVDLLSDTEMRVYERNEVVGHNCLGETVGRVRGLASASIIRGNDSITSVCERGDDMAKLV